MWISLLVNVLLAALAAKFQKPPPDPPSNDLEDFNIPVAKEGQEIGKVYGTIWLKSPQVVWYGDFKKTKIKDKQPKK